MALDAKMRTESDSLGSMEIPADAYWGIHTARALENFPISMRPIWVYRDLVVALAMVKQASARANRDIGVLDAERASLIDRAAQRVIDGEFHDQFVVGVVQGGAGTSTNMNANEVITNIALEMAGREKGDYAFLSPIDHTNRSQSTNDVYPTAVKIGLSLDLVTLLEELELLKQSFMNKAVEFHDILKIGRTQLQDAVPMTLGQEFHGFATTLGYDHQRLTENRYLLFEINMGATAIGTGITTHPGYAPAVLAHLREITGLDLATADDLVEATSDTGSFMSFSSTLKRNAMKLSKICNDLRLLSSGPRCGLGEIRLPEMAPGSSIMPGKVNPIIPEVVNQIAFQVIGSDLTVTMAAEAGQLELNAMEPVLAHNLFNSLLLLRRGCLVLAEKCIRGIEADEDRCRAYVEQSMGLATALCPYVGYDQAARIALHALRCGLTVHAAARELLGWDEARLAQLLAPEEMLAPTQPKREYFCFTDAQGPACPSGETGDGI